VKLNPLLHFQNMGEKLEEIAVNAWQGTTGYAAAIKKQLS
jgi:hypothetical protein